MNVFPPRSLPGASDTWGREIENSLNQSESEIARASSTFRNLERASSGQLATSSGVIAELLSRAAEVASLSNMSVTGNATSAPFPTTTQDHTFNGVAGGSGFLVFQAQYTESPVRPTTPAVFIRMGGSLLMRITPEILLGAAITPLEARSTGTLSGFCRIPLTSGTPPTVQVQLSRGANPSTSTITMSNVSLSLTRSGLL